MPSVLPRLLGAAAVIGALALSGCANPVERFIEEHTGLGIETDGESGLTIESDDGTLQVGTNARIPADFPSNVPLPEGELLAVITVPEGWALTYGEITADEVERLIHAVASGGFEEEFATRGTDQLLANFGDEQWAISIIWAGTTGSTELVYSVRAN